MISAAEICWRPGKFVPARHDAEQLARRQRQEVEAGVIEPIAHGDAIAPAEQQVIDGFLDLEDVDVDAQLRVAPPDSLDGARHHDLRNARYRTDTQFRQRAASDLGDDFGEIIDLLVDPVDLFEDALCFRRGEIASILALEESDAERFLGIFDQTADAGCRHIEQLGRAADGACHHDGADDFDLAQRHHIPGNPSLGAPETIEKAPLPPAEKKKRRPGGISHPWPQSAPETPRRSRPAPASPPKHSSA